MKSEEGFTKVHFVIAAVFALTVAIGSFAGVTALTSMSDSQMSEVTGQEGIKMDINLSSSFAFDAFWADGDGPSGTTSGGSVGLVNIAPTGTLNINGLTVDATTSGNLGTNGTTGGTDAAIIIGIPSIPSGIKVGAVNPGGAGTTFSLASGTSIGSVGVGDISGVTGTTIEIGAN